MAEIEWKGILWKAAYGDLSVKDLLTVLKGYGPMEILEFEKPAACRGPNQPLPFYGWDQRNNHS